MLCLCIVPCWKSVYRHSFCIWLEELFRFWLCTLLCKSSRCAGRRCNQNYSNCLCCLWLPWEGSLIFTIIASHCCRIERVIMVSWLLCHSRTNSISGKNPTCMLLYTAKKDSHIFLLRHHNVKGVPFFFALEFSCQRIVYLAKSSLCETLRGYCCAVMVTKLNSLFQAFTKYQDLCYKWFAMISMSSLLRVWSLISKTKWPIEYVNGDFSNLNLIDMIDLEILDGMQFFILPYFLHYQNLPSDQTKNFIKLSWKIPSVQSSEMYFLSFIFYLTLLRDKFHRFELQLLI